MKKHWKNAAKIAANSASSKEEIQNHLLRALICEIDPPFVNQLGDLLESASKSLFKDDQQLINSNLNEFRDSNPNSSMSTLVDYVQFEVSLGKSGAEAIQSGLASHVEEIYNSRAYQIVEHYTRETGNGTPMRGCLEVAGQKFDFQDVAARFLAGQFKDPRRIVSKKTLIEQGPAL